MPYKHISEYLFKNAKSLPKKPALVTDERSFNWAELASEVMRVADALAERLPYKEPKVIALFLPDSWQFIVTYFAIVHLGHVAMPVDVTFKKLEVDFVLFAVEPQLIVANRQTATLVDDPAILIEDLLIAKDRPTAPTIRQAANRQVATLFLSSGTTGQPKAVPNTHANQLWDVEGIAEPYGWTVEDTVLITLHLAHRHGLVICLLGAVYHGNTVFLQERFNPEEVLAILESGKISLYSTVPPAYEKLVEAASNKKIDLSKVRLFASSSSPMPPYLAKAFRARFGHDILDRYGTSETGSIAVKFSDKDRSCLPIDGVEVRTEAAGEVAVRSPGLFPGYFNNPKATAQNTTSDGWWLTGDIGEIKNGRLTLLGRSKERILKGGYSIYPQDIEWALKQNAGVTEVKVTHTKDDKSLDDKVFAFFVGRISEDELQEYSRLNLPRSWRPDVFIKTKAIPKTVNGKPSLVKLKKILAADSRIE